MQKQAVIIYGPPGSGKGTQAELLAKKFNFIHFDTGRYVENLIHSKEAEKDPILKREQKLFDSGILMTPSVVLKIVSSATNQIAKSGANIVYSGSPRTLYEAFGEKNNGLIQILEKLYGKKNIAVVKLKVQEKTSLFRNSNRLICSVCGLPALAKLGIKICSFCAGPLRKRTLDKPEVIKVRLKEYRGRTYPILAGLKKMKFRILEVNGEEEPYKVFQKIADKLNFKN